MLLDGHSFKQDMLGMDNLSAAATAWRYPTPGGRFPAMPADRRTSLPGRHRGIAARNPGLLAEE